MKRIWATVLSLAVVIVLFFAGRSVYRLGQDAAARLAGVDDVTSATPMASARPAVIIESTSTPIPSPTFFFEPTATSTRIPWTTCPGIVVRVNETSKGDVVHITRCSDGFEYEIGPLVKGVFAVSPGDKYFVYAGIDGLIYAARIGNSTLTIIHDAHREFYTFGQDMAPKYKLSFEGQSVLIVYESRYDQRLVVRMPGWLSNY